MGEVYRARDTRLERDVAIKIVHPGFAADPDRLARFEQEARAAAKLAHPNVLVVHDVGTHEGTPYVVSELLEGESLRGKLGEGPLPPRRAIEYAVGAADGLAAAHEKGIIHRDIKPENLFVTKDGRIKILDFGIAKLIQPVFPMTTETGAPTATPETGAGILLGTVSYMSPEQILGTKLDARSDIFSLGVVLYEMLSGQRPFRKDTPPETMTAILKEDPPELSQAGGAFSPALERLVRHCLEKHPEQRFQSARDVAFDLRSVQDPSSAQARPAQAPAFPSRSLLAASALLATGFALGAAAFWFARPRPPEPVRVRPLTFSGQDGEPSASPDGRLVAFTSTRDGASRIWIKQVSGGEAPLTSGPDRRPRFSPDGSSVLFLRGEGSRLGAYRASLVGGEPRKILDDVSEADWSPDGRRIAFLRSRAASSQTEWILGVVEVQGGSEKILTAVRDFSLLHVRWSPNGRTIAVIKTVAVGFSPGDEILLVDPSSGKVRALAPQQANRPVCGLAWSGFGAAIVFGQAGSAMGDNSGGALARVICKRVGSGRERTLFWASNLFPTIGGSKMNASFDVLGSGRLVFDEMSQRMNLREVSIGPGPPRGDRVLTAGSSRDRQPTCSPDGGQVVFSSNRSGNLDLWALSTRTGALKQLTDDPAQDWDPAFTSDGKHILWSSDRSGNLEIWMANADGSGARQLSRDGADAENPTSTADGAWIVYGSAGPAKQGIWKIRPDGSEATRLVPGFFSNAEVSPDGRFATFLRADRFQTTNVIDVVEIATGRVLPFQIHATYRVGPDASRILIGRSRWLPDGKAIAWLGEDESGLTGVFAQDFVPDKNTSATRRKLAGFSRDYVSESFGIFPDGKTLALSTLTLSGTLMIAEGVPDVEPPPRPVGNP